MENKKEFDITHWCGVPKSFIRHADGSIAFERLHEMKEAGFTLVPFYDYGYEVTCALLKECEQIGLKVLLNDDRIQAAFRDSENRRDLIAQVVKDYASFPALHSYHLTDEPSSADFPALAEMVRIFAELDPAHTAYINLFPNYASTRQLGNDTYEEHLRQYTETVCPALVSYDHYHFRKPKMMKMEDTGNERVDDIQNDAVKNRDRMGFFNNIEDVRSICIEKKLPFMVIVLLTEHMSYRNLTEAEIRWEVWQSLCYGARCISYFTYWTAHEDEENDRYHYKNGMLNKDGTRNPHYDMVKNVNRELQLVGNTLMPHEVQAVFHIGEPIEEKVTLWNGSYREIEGLQADALTVSFYSEGHVLLANKDYKEQTDVKLRARNGMEILRFDKKSGEWQPLANTAVALTVPAGDAVLLKFQ